MGVVNNERGAYYRNEFIFGCVEYVEEIVGAWPLSKIKIVFEVIDDNSINAFATEIDDGQDSLYFVGVHYGLINEYVNYFAQSKNIQDLTDGFTALNQLPVEFLEEAALSIAFCFTAYHELGHIYRGHLAYFRENFFLKGFKELSVNRIDVDDGEYNETRHLFECDADAFAGILISGEVTSRYKKGVDSGLISGGSNRLLEELTIFTGSIIYFIFCLFDKVQTEFDGFYPVPPIRASIAIAHLRKQLFKESTDDNRIDSLFKEALARTQGIINQSGMVQATEDLESEFERWSSKYTDKLAGLEKSLEDYGLVLT